MALLYDSPLECFCDINGNITLAIGAAPKKAMLPSLARAAYNPAESASKKCLTKIISVEYIAVIATLKKKTGIEYFIRGTISGDLSLLPTMYLIKSPYVKTHAQNTAITIATITPKTSQPRKIKATESKSLVTPSTK